MAQTQLTPSLLSAALEGLEHQKARIDEQIAEVRSMLAGTAPKQAQALAPAPSSKKKSPKKTRAKRDMSEAARKRISEAQRKRWDAYRQSKEQS